MSRSQWMVSLFLVWHLGSLGVSSFAPPEDVLVTSTGRRVAHDWLSRVVTPLADAAAASVEPLNLFLWRATMPLRAVASPYIHGAGLHQRWQMFVAPARELIYLRARYYWQPASEPASSGEVLTTTRIVFPVDREDEPKLLASFRNRYRNKATTNIMEDFYDVQWKGLEDDSRPLEPVLAFHTRRFQSEDVSAERRVLRAELWYGAAPIAEPGQRVAEDQSTAHLGALRRYYADPRPEVVLRRAYPRRWVVEREADIVWTLVHIERGPS